MANHVTLLPDAKSVAGPIVNPLLGPSRNDGATDGTRTHDDRDHNPGLYQLSYRRHREGEHAFCALSRRAGL